MKAFVVTIVTPEGWTTQDVLIAINMGAQAHCRQQQNNPDHKLEMGIGFNARIHEKFELRRE
jgi:hypothetical protein